ncbi:Large-conductance mechanosensitive channel [uncultured bacterium]|nr:Large-conductance mechanosensitive channel [uncultured bacterium]
MFKEFKEFAFKGSLVDMAIGIVIGVAFGALINSFVKDVLMPPIGLFIGSDFSNLFVVLREGATPGPYASLEEARAAAAITLNYGVFINFLVNFLIIAFAMFLVITWAGAKKKEKEQEAAMKECPWCLSEIPVRALRCSHCTSNLEEKRAA